MTPEQAPEPILEKKIQETAEKRDAVDTLFAEAEARLKNFVAEDSGAYKEACIKMVRYLSQMKGAADIMSAEIRNERKEAPLPKETRDTYENALQEIESLMIILPQHMQQARILQYDPVVQDQLKRVGTILDKQQTWSQSISDMRFSVLKVGAVKGEKLHPSTARHFAPIADKGWRIREEFSLPPAFQKGMQILEKDEKKFQDVQKETGQTENKAKIVFDAKRKNEGAELITQGLPGAEYIHDAASISLYAWKRLLTEGGPNERARAARELRVQVEKYETDFMKGKAYDEFISMADSARKELQGKNANIRYWFELLGIGKKFNDTVLTGNEEFDGVYKNMTEAMKTRFDDIHKMPESASIKQMTDQLQAIEKGQAVDSQRLSTTLDEYGSLQTKSLSLLADLQRWYVSITEGTTTNPGQENTGMLEHITRIGPEGKTAITNLRDFSPYGVYQRRLYYDTRTGRPMLVNLPDSPTSKGVLGHGIESAKIVGVATVTPLLHRILLKAPFIKGPLRSIFARLGFPIALAEAQMDTASRGASLQVAKDAQQDIERSLGRLLDYAQSTQRTIRPPEDMQKMHMEAQLLNAKMIVLLHAAKYPNDPTARDSSLVLEAQLLTNQILMAFGFPPSISPAAQIQNLKLDDIPKAERSPNVTNYLTTKEKDEAARGKEVDASLTESRKKKEGLKSAILSVQILGNTLPPSPWSDQTKKQLQGAFDDAMKSDTFRSEIFAQTVKELGPVAAEQQQKAIEIAGKLHHIYNQLDAIAAILNKRTGRSLDRLSITADSPLYAEQFSVNGQIFSLKQAESDLSELATILTPQMAMTIARLIEERPPSNIEIAKHWLNREHPSVQTGFSGWIARRTSSLDSYIDGKFLPEEKRHGIGKLFIEDFVLLKDYQNRFMQ